MYYKLTSRPNHNQPRFMPSFASVVHNQFPRASFFNDQVRISHVLLFEERVVPLQVRLLNFFVDCVSEFVKPPISIPAPAPVATVTLQPPPPTASTAPANSSEDDVSGLSYSCCIILKFTSQLLRVTIQSEGRRVRHVQ